MKIAVVTSHPVQYHAPIFRELSRRVDLTVLYAHRTTAAQQAAAGYGVRFDWDVDLLGGYKSEFLNNVSSRPTTAHFNGCDVPDIHAILRRARYDALLLTGWHLKVYWQAVWAAKRLRLPTMVRGDSHLGTPRSRLKQLAKQIAYPGLLRAFDVGLYVGKRNYEYWRHYHFPPERLVFAPHCVDEEFFRIRATPDAGRALRRSMGIPAEVPVALFVGRLVPFKRPVDLVRAIAILRRRRVDAHVLVAGAGECEELVREAARALGVHVHVLGFQNQSQMPAVYAAADVLVLPSAHETWGLVANEALASGLRVVVSDAVGCAPDLACNHEMGRVFPLSDVDALADKIEDLFRMRPTRCDRSTNSGHYSISGAVQGIVDGAKVAISHGAQLRGGGH